MTAEWPETRTPLRRWASRALAPAVAVALVMAPGIARAGSGDDRSGAGDPDQMIAEARGLEQKIVEFWNARKWDEYAALYEDDALAIPPNHEPIQGNKTIAEFYKSVRDATGEIEGGTETFRAIVSGDLVDMVGKYSAYSGRLRFTTHEVYRRQPDGSLKMATDMFGFRDPGQ